MNDTKETFKKWKRFLKENNDLLSKLDLEDELKLYVQNHGVEGAIEKFSFAIPNKEAINTIKSYSPIIEIGAGSGYWAKLLSQHGVDIKAYDSYPSKIHFPVEKGGPKKVKENKDRTLFLCYPDLHSSMAYNCLLNYQQQLKDGKVLILVGEQGITADDMFWDGIDNLFLNEIKIVQLPHFPGYTANLHVFRI